MHLPSCTYCRYKSYNFNSIGTWIELRHYPNLILRQFENSWGMFKVNSWNDELKVFSSFSASPRMLDECIVVILSNSLIINITLGNMFANVCWPCKRNYFNIWMLDQGFSGLWSKATTKVYNSLRKTSLLENLSKEIYLFL